MLWADRSLTVQQKFDWQGTHVSTSICAVPAASWDLIARLQAGNESRNLFTRRAGCLIDRDRSTKRISDKLDVVVAAVD